MSKKIIVVICILLALAGFIITGLYGENAVLKKEVLATYCEFDTSINLIEEQVNGSKHMNLPSLSYGQVKEYDLTTMIKYDDDATASIYEISATIVTNYKDIAYLQKLMLYIDCSTLNSLPSDLSITVTIQTNDGSNLTDTLYIYEDSSSVITDW